MSSCGGASANGAVNVAGTFDNTGGTLNVYGGNTAGSPSVVTTNILNQHRRTVIVVPLSSSLQAGPPLLVPIVCDGQPAVAVLDQIRAVAKERLHKRMGVLSTENMQSVEEGLREILEL